MTDLKLSPLGLQLAAMLTVCNVFADIARKKVGKGHEAVAAAFWVSVFSAMVFTSTVVWRSVNGSPMIIHAPASLTPGDIKDMPSLVSKLRQGSDPVSQLLVSRLSEASRESKDSRLSEARRRLLEGLKGNGTDSKTLMTELLAYLNSDKVLRGTSIYDESRFAGVNISADAKRVMGQKPKGENMAYLNRLLLEDAYPNEIVQNRTSVLFGVPGWRVPPLAAYLIYQSMNVVLISICQLLLMKALQVSPMSLCIPFMAFTPMFLIVTAYVMLGELPSVIKLMGVGLIIIGSMAMHRKLFSTGWTGPIQAIVKEKGSRYILLVAFVLSITSPVEKQLIFMSDQMVPAFGYGIGLVIFFAILARVRRVKLRVVMRDVPIWAVTAGILDAGGILLQYFTITYLAVVIATSIKRAGIVLAILAGWLFFKEKEITDKLIAAGVMIGGVAIFYLPLSLMEALSVVAIILTGMTVALYVTHPKAAAPNTAVPS